MSKAVRIREHLYEEIERLAKEEKRSLISQLEILLEQALKLDAGLTERDEHGDAGPSSRVRSRESQSAARGLRSSRSASPDAHFKPDPK